MITNGELEVECAGHKQAGMSTEKTLGQEDAIEAIERVRRLAQHQASDYRTMRSLLLRIHSARVGMNEAAVIAALDDVDDFFREENTN